MSPVKKITSCVAILLLTILSYDAQAQALPASELSLDEAIGMALGNSPRIQGVDAGILAAKGERRQASAFPNPSLGMDVENIGGTGSYNGADSAEITIGASQLVELGGKRSARMAIADAGQDIAAYDQTTTQLDLIRDVKVAFTNAVAAQEQVIIAEQQVGLANDVLNTVTKRVDAAAEPVIQKNKARVSLSNAQIAYEKAKREKTATAKNLFNLWGATPSDIPLAKEQFYTIAKPKANTQIEDVLIGSVDHKRQIAAVNQAKSVIDLEKANAVPDPSFNVGVRELRQNNDQAFVVGFSVPLPVFNINGGNIAKARAEAVRADADRRDLLLDKRDKFNDYTQQLESSYVAASAIKNEVLPQAEEAFSQAKRGYNAGKFAYLEVLDAQRTLVETKQSYIESLQQYQIGKVELERLTAQADVLPSEKNNAK